MGRNCNDGVKRYGVALLAIGLTQALLGACILLSLVSGRRALIAVLIITVAGIPVAIGAISVGIQKIRGQCRTAARRK
jgi:hypothetical protein